MANLFSLIKNAAAMRGAMAKMQAELRAQTVRGEAGNGLVTVTARGDATLAAIAIDPRAMDPARPDRLEALVLAAAEKALAQAKAASAETMKRHMGEMGLPNIPGLG